VGGDAPDLMAYFDSLRVRPVQTVGWESPWLEGNDRGARRLAIVNNLKSRAIIHCI
jgi:hypothetical protein